MNFRRPTRTCIGCRQRAAAAELFRVVVAPDAIGKVSTELRTPEAPSRSDELGDGPVALPVVPDTRRRIPGRGAWLHPDLRCVELAERRRAFARALRVSGPVDPASVSEYVAQVDSRRNPPSGTPQEMKS